MSPYIRNTLVVGSAFLSSASTARGVAPPVFVMYRKSGNNCFCKVELGCTRRLHSVGTPANPVIRSLRSI